jgi:hypothetical protein
MNKKLNNYQFVNSQTGNIIAYLSLPVDVDGDQLTELLKKRRAELAIEHKLFYEVIFWQDKNHPIG